MKGAKKNKKEQPKEVKIGFSSNKSTPKIVSKKSSKLLARNPAFQAMLQIEWQGE